ncbi:hypothetical protein [Simiduia agarivorans]|uniref:Family 2 glycosyl transferase n=1 Tax=Simiduia agarivorans (strain DSM 21679 / JCM 13881 / BCRC 17597 / SA1) TaxID=1117647 RepID=K4KIF7_SIMAS|nr:hypothetical protein [Simiduia agarivorans]AFU97743.1 family 2 glycosyl transferase [Simiduia agarivorans SA1 = DSM 21679]
MKLIISVASVPAWKDWVCAININTIDSIDVVEFPPKTDMLVEDPIDVFSLDSRLDELNVFDEVFVFYQTAEYFIVNTLKSGSDIEKASRLWSKEIKQLLDIQRLQRHRIKLVDIHSPYEDLEKTRSILVNQGLKISGAEFLKKGNSYELLLASQYVSQCQYISDMSSMVYACSIPVRDDMGYSFNISALFDNLRLKSQKVILLEEQISCLQKEAERHFFQSKRQAETWRRNHEAFKLVDERWVKRLENKENEICKLDAKLKESYSYKRQLTKVESEKAILLEQLQLVQEELESYFIRFNSLEQQRDRLHLLKEANDSKNLRHEIKQLKSKLAATAFQLSMQSKEMDSVKSSFVWKGFAPIRMVKKALRGDGYENILSDCALLLTSEYFDVQWYLEAYKDVAEAGINPAEHYIKYGASEGRYPSLKFDGNWYLSHYPDVANSGMNPLIHFIKFGQAEGRQPSLLRLPRS